MGHASPSRAAALCRVLAVQAQREGGRPITVAFHYHPLGVFQVIYEAVLEHVIPYWNTCGQNHQPRALVFPERVNDGSHQPQHTARSLEAIQAGQP